MKRKILLICVSFSLAVVGLWLLTSGLARAADQHLGLRPTDNPLGVPGAVLTPTLRLVGGPGGETLFSSPVFCVHVSEPLSCSLYVRNPLTRAVSMVAERVEISSADGASVPGMLGLSPVSQTVAADKVGTFTLSLVEGWLPAGTYSGTLEFSAEGTQPAVEQFVLLVSPWSAELEWAQEEFVYVADEAHTEAIVRFVARLGDAKDIRAQLPTLMAKDAVTMPFKTMDFLSITVPPTLARDTVAELALNFTVAKLPMPETYNGELQLIASNAAPITAPFTLVVPDRARGSYQLVVAELGQTPAVTTALTLTTALQFTGVRWLPASTSAASWWPVVAAALLFGVGLAVLTGYTVWGLAGPAPKAEVKVEGWWPKVRQWLQKAWAWVRGHPKVSLGLMAGTLALIVLVLSLLFDLTQAHVGDRNLLIWEAEGRGPVREVTVFGGEVVNQIGDWGRIRIGNYDGEIAAQDVLTVPVTGIQGVSQPGVYQGSILVQSPDIAGGLVKVPVQVTVHDLIFWPALVILLGVVLGGWAKYQQEIASQRLEKRKDIERVWQRWDDYMLHDNYLWPPSAEGVREINPIYEQVWWDLDYARELLAEEDEWGIEDAERIVNDVGERLTTYQRLAQAVADWRDEQERETDETSKQQLHKWIDEVEQALYRGDLDHATNLIGKMIQKTLPVRIGRLDSLANTIADEKAKKAIQALLTEAKELYIEENYGQAWLKFKQAEYETRALGLERPPIVPSSLKLEFIRPVLEGAESLGIVPREEVDNVLSYLGEGVVPTTHLQNAMWKVLGVDTPATTFVSQMLGLKGYAGLAEPPSPEERYVIRSPGWIRRRVRETILLRAEYHGKNPPQEVEFQWNIQPDNTAKPTPKPTPETGIETRVEFREEGLYKVMVIVSQGGASLPNKQPAPLELYIGPSGMEAIYQAKRRHSFNRRLAALLLALVGGMVAKQVFGLTFGSVEEYLGAFGWGVGVSAGIDPVAGGYETLKQKVQELLKLGSTT